MRQAKAHRVTLLDRLAVALFSGLLALLTGGLIWFAIGSIGLWLPFEPVLWFAAIMAGLGYFLRENLIVNVLGASWKALSSILP